MQRLLASLKYRKQKRRMSCGLVEEMDIVFVFVATMDATLIVNFFL